MIHDLNMNGGAISHPLDIDAHCATKQCEDFCSTDFWICRAEQLKGARLKELQDPDACRIHKR